MTGTAGLTWPDLLARLQRREDLRRDEAAWAMGEVMDGSVGPAVLAGFLVGLGTKGETVEEVLALSDTMIAHARPVAVTDQAVDLVGTGGDRHHTVNISTMAAIVVAGTGVRVVKHGNRAASSASGTADVLEALGVRLDLPAERVQEVLDAAGITFLFAGYYHPAMRHAAAVRSELRIPTTFNVLGPLSNPAQPRAGAIGVGSPAMAPVVAGVFAERGRSTLVFRGDDGLDELAATSVATVWESTPGTGGAVVEHRLDAAADLGFAAITLPQLRGGDAATNAAVVRDLLDGRASRAVRETVALNAAAALVADGTLPGTGAGTLPERLTSGLQHAHASLSSGAAGGVLERWIAVTRN